MSSHELQKLNMRDHYVALTVKKFHYLDSLFDSVTCFFVSSENQVMFSK